MRTKIRLSGDPIVDLNILQTECSNNNQICYHIKTNKSIVDYLETTTGMKGYPVVVLFYHYKENIKEIPKCICGKDRKYHCYGYRPTCTSKKCQSIIREESKRKFCLNKYGVEYVTQLDSMKEKSKISCLEKFGVDNCTKSPDIIKRRKENNFKKYGVTDTLMLKSVRGNESQRGIRRIQSTLPKGYKAIESDKIYYYKIVCPNGHTFEIGKSSVYLKKKNDVEICNKCNEYVGSKGEQEVYDYIISIYKGNILRSNRKLIKPFEIDMVLEDIKLCIEFNGDYWHSTKIVDNKYYHLNKLTMCLMKGYDLIQIRENDWNTNKDNIKRKLSNLINNIFDKRDLNIVGEHLIFDMSWHDSRIIKGMESLLEMSLDPDIIEVGQYLQWDCGHKVYKIF